MALICDITKRLPNLVKPEAYCPFLIFHIGTTPAVIRILRIIKRNSISHGKMLKGSEAKVVFSSVLPARD